MRPQAGDHQRPTRASAAAGQDDHRSDRPSRPGPKDDSRTAQGLDDHSLDDGHPDSSSSLVVGPEDGGPDGGGRTTAQAAAARRRHTARLVPRLTRLPSRRARLTW